MSLPWGHVGATWQIRFNLCFLQAYPSHQPKRQTDRFRFFAQLSSHSSGMPMHVLSPNNGGSGPHLIHGSLGPPESWIQTASWSVQPFLQGLLVWQTDRQTDHATQSVTIGRIYVLWCGMRPNYNNSNCRLTAEGHNFRAEMDVIVHSLQVNSNP